ncbi:MAG: DUF481 domain-containing protein [Sulfuricurvum sp.]|uniref:DUF481 domain-containing protein n=1 Tax=Sulfuricurvum sp. TaxID=2025608 RepID=UPI002628D679|nr:DUF481 domain-containing protein [Sulfuricurvum sp.]MDD3597797.1 DUF481 domain-containing protein [Sulfuricurvum sp.]MDD4883281.1 DUF481 domain-containing protein [Sulfuricurvum sp.]
MIRRLLWITLGGSSLMAADVCPLPEHNGDIVTHSEFSYIDSKGNSNTSSLAFEGNAKTKWDLHILRVHLDAYRASSDGETSKNKWSSEFNYDYQFDEVYSLNYMIGYKEDHFSGYEYKFYTGPGIGMKAIDEKTQQLDFQANLLFGRDKPDNDDSENYFSTNLGGIYKWKIQENLKFIQEATYRVKLDDTKYYFLYSKSAIESKINSTLSMGLSYKVDYANTPPAPSLHTDRTFLASLIIDY